MAFELDNFLALVFRLGIMVVVFYLLFQKFYRDYQKSKKSGFVNYYFLGFSALFLIMLIFHILYGSYELYSNTVADPVNLKSQFNWYSESEDWIGKIANNQMRPAYLIFYFLTNLVLAAQIYPLELANGWKKNPVMRTIIVCGSSLWLNFIPAIGTSAAAAIIVILGFAGIGIGFLTNIAINIKLYIKSAGVLRRRALYAIFAFIFFAVGILWSMEMGFGEAIHESISYRWDVVVGSVLQIVGAFFYRVGYSKEGEISLEKEEKIGEKLTLIENIKGKFTRYDLMDWLFIGGVLGFLFLALAWHLYPLENNYSIMKDTISFLGSSDGDNNPQGWPLFTVSLIIFGIMLTPVAIYRFKKLRKINKMFSIFSLLFYLIANLGLILIALFPDNGGESFIQDLDAGKLHNTVAMLSIGGFALAILVDFIVFLVDVRKNGILNKKVWIPVYIVFFVVVVMTAYTQIYWELNCESNCWPGDGIYSFPLWEWIVFLTMFGVLFAKDLSLPKSFSNFHKKKE